MSFSMFLCTVWSDTSIEYFLFCCVVKLLKMQRVLSFNMKLKHVKLVQEHGIGKLDISFLTRSIEMTVEVLVQEHAYHESRPVWILLSSFSDIWWFTRVFSWNFKRALKVRFSFLCLTDEQHSRRLNFSASFASARVSSRAFFCIQIGWLPTPTDAHQNCSSLTPRLVVESYIQVEAVGNRLLKYVPYSWQVRVLSTSWSLMLVVMYFWGTMTRH